MDDFEFNLTRQELRDKLKQLRAENDELITQLAVAVKIEAADKQEFDYKVLDRIAELEEENKHILETGLNWRNDYEKLATENEKLNQWLDDSRTVSQQRLIENIALKEENEKLSKVYSELVDSYSKLLERTRRHIPDVIFRDIYQTKSEDK